MSHRELDVTTSSVTEEAPSKPLKGLKNGIGLDIWPLDYVLDP